MYDVDTSGDDTHLSTHPFERTWIYAVVFFSLPKTRTLILKRFIRTENSGKKL